MEKECVQPAKCMVSAPRGRDRIPTGRILSTFGGWSSDHNHAVHGSSFRPVPVSLRDPGNRHTKVVKFDQLSDVIHFQ